MRRRRAPARAAPRAQHLRVDLPARVRVRVRERRDVRDLAHLDVLVHLDLLELRRRRRLGLRIDVARPAVAGVAPDEVPDRVLRRLLARGLDHLRGLAVEERGGLLEGPA
jgi:hypothetical protein